MKILRKLIGRMVAPKEHGGKKLSISMAIWSLGEKTE